MRDKRSLCVSRTKGSCFCLATLFVAVSKLLQGGKKESKVTALVVQLMNIVFSDVSLLNYFPLFMYFLSRHFSFISVFIFMFKTKIDIRRFRVHFGDWNKEKQNFLVIVIVLLIYFSFKRILWHLIFNLEPKKFYTWHKVFFSTY